MKIGVLTIVEMALNKVLTITIAHQMFFGLVQIYSADEGWLSPYEDDKENNLTLVNSCALLLAHTTGCRWLMYAEIIIVFYAMNNSRF